MIDDILEDAGVELVDDLLSNARGEDEVGVAKHGKVSRDGGPRGVEMLRDFAGRERTVFQEAEDVTPGGVREGLERAVHTCIIS
jgi:hypothetical protein